MKKLLFIPFVAISCQANQANTTFITLTKEDSAKSTVKLYLDKTLNDTSSYEPVEWSRIDSSFKFRSSDTTIGLTNAWSDLSLKKTEVISGDKKGDTAVIQQQMDSIMREHNRFRDFNGWKITHTFRASNAYGGNVISTQTFYLTQALDNIVDVDEKK
jgi:hypothetical protein